MNKFTKIGIVIAGYIVAFLVGNIIVYIRDIMTAGTDAQASQGMYAFGQDILFLMVFGLFALVPTLLALYWLRPVKPFWNTFTLICLIFAILGPVLAIANTVFGHNLDALRNPLVEVISLGGLLYTFGSPLFLIGFLILAVIAPSGRLRLRMILSAGLEVFVGLYVFVNIFFLQRFF